MRYLEKLHDGVFNVSVIDCMNHLLICVHVLVALQTSQWKISTGTCEDVSYEKKAHNMNIVSVSLCVCD